MEPAYNAQYVSRECLAWHADEAWHIRRLDDPSVVVAVFGRPTDAWAIMLELDEGARTLLGLPECDAVTGGTALCLALRSRADAGQVPVPRAPTCWSELVDAELWPLGWLGRHDGVEPIVLEDGR